MTDLLHNLGLGGLRRPGHHRRPSRRLQLHHPQLDIPDPGGPVHSRRPADGNVAGAIGIGLLSGAVMLLVGMGMFAMGWIGGGDAKLLAATAMWIGWPSMVTFILVTTLAGGALAVLLVAARSSFLQVHAARAPRWVGRLMQPGGNAPYGIAIAIGALVAFPASSIIAAGI